MWTSLRESCPKKAALMQAVLLGDASALSEVDSVNLTERVRAASRDG